MDVVVASTSQMTLDMQALRDVILPQFETAESVNIATGYITGDAVAYLENFVSQNGRPHIDLLIGMHYAEGSFTESQYHAVKRLSDVLTAKGLGKVYLSTQICYHGKMYAFLNAAGKCFAASVGSSNLGGAFLGSETTIEADCVFDEPSKCALVRQKIDELFLKIGTEFHLVEKPVFKKTNHPLEHVLGVSKIPSSQVADAFAKKTTLSFDLEMKTESKSNLNVFFATGRYSKATNTYRPRPWYEVEIIVSKTVTSQKGYPIPMHPFDVVTSDGWGFKCETGGSFNKNFRSHGDLRILGRWIKGAMEGAGALKTGDKITSSVLSAFGHKFVRLTKTSESNLWTMEFV